jgi:haloacetate dehalogenase
MAALGFARFAVVGHDRGGRVGYRMALDHPERLTRLAVLDIMPTLESADRMNVRLALAEYHWLFLAQPHPLPETLIGGAPDFYLTHTLESWAGRKGAFDERALAEYRRCFRKPSVVRAACEDYRAGLSVDLEHDGGDRAVGRRISCPVLALWGGEAGDAYALDHLATWGRWAARVTGRSIACGHFLMEEAPEETASALLEFLTD